MNIEKNFFGTINIFGKQIRIDEIENLLVKEIIISILRKKHNNGTQWDDVSSDCDWGDYSDYA